MRSRDAPRFPLSDSLFRLAPPNAAAKRALRTWRAREQVTSASRARATSIRSRAQQPAPRAAQATTTGRPLPLRPSPASQRRSGTSTGMGGTTTCSRSWPSTWRRPFTRSPTPSLHRTTPELPPSPPRCASLPASSSLPTSPRARVTGRWRGASARPTSPSPSPSG